VSIRPIFEESVAGRRAVRFSEQPDFRPLEEILPGEQRRQSPARLPEVSELDLMRHYSGLTRANVGVDTTFYPSARAR